MATAVKKTATKEPLKTLPGHSTNTRHPDLGIKDIILAMPICPKSQIRGRFVNGRYEPPVIGPEDVNCQLEGGMWWRRCERDRGHDPYWTTRQRRVTKTTIVKDADGDSVPQDKEIIIEDRMLNVTSVSNSTRVNSGGGVTWKKRYFGFRDISEFGYEEVCHLSRCQKPITIVNKAYGSFCTQAHLEVAAAEEEEKIIPRTAHEFAKGEERAVARAKRKALKESVMEE
jgi:hypothetical protein